MIRNPDSAIESRLLGTWRSDKKKTMAELSKYADIAPEQKDVFSRIFGKLRVKYTRTRIHTDLEGMKTVTPYRVVARDSDSVAIVYREDLVHCEGRILHIHFEGDRYWISLGDGRCREFFKRVAP